MDKIQSEIQRARAYMDRPYRAMAESQGYQFLRQAVWSLILAVEELSSKATPPSETSSAPIPGLAPKPSELFTGMHVVDGGSPLDVPGWLKQAIMDSFKSMPLHTGISFLAQTPCSLTLQLTWPLPGKSTETKAGILGDAGPECEHQVELYNPYPDRSRLILHRDFPEAGLTCIRCGAPVSIELIAVQDVAPTTSTSQKPASQPSAQEQEAAESPSRSCGDGGHWFNEGSRACACGDIEYSGGN